MTSGKKIFSNIYAPVSVGELIDKITILEIKKKNMTGKKLKNVERELELLELLLKEENLEIDNDLVHNLKKVNNTLWEIEDRIRIKESRKEFDNDFIELARSVYKENDRRASIKKEINYIFNSKISEEKSYKKY